MRISITTIKTFIKANSENLYIKTQSKFNGMIDGLEYVKDGFEKAELCQDHIEYTLGVKGAWFVGSSRDWKEPFENETMKGYRIVNCCGSFILATPKNKQDND